MRTPLVHSATEAGVPYNLSMATDAVTKLCSFQSAGSATKDLAPHIGLHYGNAQRRVEEADAARKLNLKVTILYLLLI